MDRPDASRPSAGAGRRHVTHPARGLIRWVSNNNPFYPLSAVLVLAGLRMSFDPQAHAFPAWAFLAGLAAYTILMAATACVLVRLGNVWEDVRTLLLLIVVAFVGIAMIFDDVLMHDRRFGRLCDLGAAIFAIGLSEATLRGMRLRLPALYRAPFYLGLALVFLYPAALAPLLDRPADPELAWALFGFSAAAGLVALSLLPAIRKGPAYVAKNGSPWRWPLFPWALFAILGLGLAARGASLCWSMQAPSFPELRQSVFRPYFLVPLGLAASLLVLELGLVTRSRAARHVGLAMPAGLLALAMVGHGAGADSVSGRFLGAFTDALGGTPPFLTLLAAAAFYAAAASRRIPAAIAWLTASLAALAVVGPGTLTPEDLTVTNATPLWIAAALQGILALKRPTTGRLTSAAAFASVAAAVAVAPRWGPGAGAALGVHLAIAAALALGAAFRDGLARSLRVAGLTALSLASLAALRFESIGLPGVSREAIRWYPLLASSIALLYGWRLRDRTALAAAMPGLIGWAAIVGGRGYAGLRPSIAGLDQIALGLASFAVAALVSLAKVGVLARWLVALRERLRHPPV